ncbi:MAG TPA: tRNA (cytidine(34)-2'-O)-methyltransferase [Alphaproteobacteria bacterium]|nr:tRNA (cytidine(34)-2'-O)-methyltransferase [Alphaproteobacteria bacterium]
MSLHIALFEPEIPQNTGTILRLAACLNVTVDLIEPLGFLFDDKKLKRSGMDYIEHVTYKRHESFKAFSECYKDRRIILIDTKGPSSFLDFAFEKGDILLLGKESTGVPDSLSAQLKDQIHIPMVRQLRSLNVAIAGAMVVTEALRQLKEFPC